MNKHYKALELDKVLAMLSEETTCEDARYEAEHLTPQTNIDLARVLLKQTDDAFMLMAKFGSPSFGGLKNVNNSLHRANAGGALNMRELLDIAEVLRVIRGLKSSERTMIVVTHEMEFARRVAEIWIWTD